MHYAILEEKSQEALKILQGINFRTKIVKASQGSNALNELSRVPVEMLVLDIGTGPGLSPAVLRYRLNRADTRIILLAESAVPGSAEVARIVQAGVYDVVTDINKLEDVIKSKPAGLDAAAKWLDPELSHESKNARKKQVIEKIIERKVPISQRPVYIGICGTASGVGTTTVASMISYFLAQEKYKTILIETGEASLEILTGLNLSKPISWYPYLDVCKAKDPKEFIKKRKWQYVIVDMGVKRPIDIQDDFDKMFAVIPQITRIQRAKEWFDYYNVTYLAIGKEPGRIAKSWTCSFDNIFEIPKIEKIKIVNTEIPYKKEITEQCRKILADVLPEKQRKTRGFKFKVPLFK